MLSTRPMAWGQWAVYFIRCLCKDRIFFSKIFIPRSLANFRRSIWLRSPKMAQKWARRDTKNMVLRLLPLYSYGQVQRSKSEICFFAFLNSKKVFCRKQFQCPRESNPRPSDPALESKTFLAQRSIACCLIPYLSKGLVEATQIFYLV